MIGRRAMGNYAYASARVKTRKSFLYPKETYLKLLQMDLPEISRFIEESRYKKEIDELANKYSGIDLLEYALNLNMAREMNEVLDFCQGEMKILLGAYLMKWDVWNIKSILRGKNYGASEDEIKETFVPAGELRTSTLVDLIHKGSIPDVIEGLNGTRFYKPLTSSLEDFNKTQNLSRLENNLDKAYYAYLLSIKLAGTSADELMMTFVRREVDITNLRTLFRLKRQGLEHEKIMEFLVPGGKLKADDMRKFAQAPSFDEFVNLLKDTPYWTDLSEAIENYRATKSLNAIEVALTRADIGYADKISHAYPLSILPILGYTVRKQVEVTNIRTIARGKEVNLSNEVIRNQLVI
ncbi:V-type ATP synthase subunit C [Methanocella sp. MCL-LM]|uniref:V-type ATP synthase subunit C n=1 Tax=Methanocella sp. MCL-LM TaxID=3412035 RepID=UPI003C73B336